MKCLLFVSAAALLVTACDTVPHGQPYPPPDYPPPAYPGDAYPPGPYPPDQGYPAPSPYPSGPQLACPIAASRDWTAWVNAMPGPGSRPKLIVTGKIMTASAGYQISFDPNLQIRKSYPAQAFATLQVIPPREAANQGLFTQDVHWEWPLNQLVGSVEVRCGDETLAHIAPVATAH